MRFIWNVRIIHWKCVPQREFETKAKKIQRQEHSSWHNQKKKRREEKRQTKSNKTKKCVEEERERNGKTHFRQYETMAQ